MRRQHPSCPIDRATFLTHPDDFTDVSRGNPLPHTLKGEALVKARLTPETWRLEIEAEGKAKIDHPTKLDAGTALDLPGLLALGQKHGVKFLKAMQCNNIAQPLGQGLWEGVPLREVLRTSGKMSDVRRVYYWGFHNNDPKQMFQSSLAINQVLDTPPGELPPFVAYRLNGQPIPLERGGPVRMVVPWAHGFKSIKWLQHIMLTNDYRANDTYALQNNDPESYLKTAAYLDDHGAAQLSGRQAGRRSRERRWSAGPAWSGSNTGSGPSRALTASIGDDDPAWKTALWRPCCHRPSPDRLGRRPAGRRQAEPGLGLRSRWQAQGVAHAIQRRTLVGRAFTDLKPGGYEFRVRTVDKNGFAQPEPRPFHQTIRPQRHPVQAIHCDTRMKDEG